MSEYRYVGKKLPRDDAFAKVTGQLKFYGDVFLEDAYHGAVVRAAYPHAKILRIDYEEALKCEGVIDVVTAKDVPGLNLFGIGGYDQPVLCQDKTRFIGDPVAVVVAKTERQAYKAVDKVIVDYEELEVVTDLFRAKEVDAPPIQENGNIGSHFEFKPEDIEEYFGDDYVVVENDYQTQYQEHAYLETEVAFACPTPEGGMEVWAPAQYAYRDRIQLSRILNIPEAKIFCHSNPIGGGFGGKDDMSLQPLAAVSAQKLNHMVRIHLDREESFLYSTKRVPFTFHMKTSADKEGHLMAHKVEAYGNVGPFTGISVAVFNYGVENAFGAYYFPHVDIMGEAVYTNSAHTGSFRGFGNNQLNWGLEMQLDELADKIGIDRLTFRAMNLTKTGKRLSYGHIHEGCDGLSESFEVLKHSKLWQNREDFKKGAKHPWLKRGIGIATGQHGNGLGNALKDEGVARFTLKPDGSMVAYIGMEEMGQGLLTSCHIIAAEKADVAYDRITVVAGNTTECPDTGPTTASRSTYVSGNAISAAIENFFDGVTEALKRDFIVVSRDYDGMLCDGNHLEWDEVYRRLPESATTALGKCIVPITDLHIQIGLHCMHTHVTQITGVEVNTLTGKVDVLETEILPAAGTVINRLGYEGQCEGGIAMAMGYAIMEDYKMGEDGRPLTKNFQTYMVPTIRDIPETIIITPMENYERTGPFGAKGIGEPVTIPGTPAITNAIRDACGISVRELPATPERVLKLLKERE